MANDSIYVTACSDTVLENISEDLRKRLGLERDSFLDPFDVIHRVSDAGYPSIELKILPDTELPDEDAYTAFEPTRIFVRASVAAKARQGDARSRFTLFHELGHAVLHPGLPKARKTVVALRPDKIPPQNDSERQANVFAAAIMMPRPFVKQCSNHQELAKRTGASKTAAEYRFKHCFSDSAKVTPPDLQEGIERMKRENLQPKRLKPTGSVLRLEVQKRLSWDFLSELEGYDPDQFRLVDQRWLIRWELFGHEQVGGWRLNGDKIVAYEDQRSR